MRLRPRQKTFVERSVAALASRGNTLGVAPTGAGKTIMLSAVTGEMIGDGAKACVLAGVKGPSASSDYHEDAMNYFCDIAWDRELGAKVEMTDRSTMHLTLWIDKETPINNHMVEAGWATVVSKPDSRLKEYVSELIARTRRF